MHLLNDSFIDLMENGLVVNFSEANEIVREHRDEIFRIHHR